MTSALVHHAADFAGVPSSVLRDSSALSGMMVSAIGAAGLQSADRPILRSLPRDGFAIVILLDAGHVTLHTFPDDGRASLDLLCRATHNAPAAIDVVARRLHPGTSTTHTTARG